MSVLSQLFRRQEPAGAPRNARPGYEYWTRDIARTRPGQRRLEDMLAHGWEIVNVIPARFLGSHATYTFRRPFPTVTRAHYVDDCWCEAGSHR